jgi:hypothetical protein
MFALGLLDGESLLLRKDCHFAWRVARLPLGLCFWSAGRDDTKERVRMLGNEMQAERRSRRAIARGGGVGIVYAE